MANWTFNFIVSLTFLLLIEALGRTGAFWFYGGDRHPHPLVLLEVRAGDQGQAPRGHPGLLPGPGRRAAPAAPPAEPGCRVPCAGCGSTRSSPRGGRPSRSSSSRRRRRRRPSSCTRPRATLGQLEPDFVSVTYGAGGSTRDGTVEITKALKDDVGLETMAHLSCVGETTEGLAATLDRIAAAGIENVFALRGDPPRGRGGLRPARGRPRQRRRAGRLHRRRLGLRDRRRLLPGGPPRGARPRDRPLLPEDEGRLRRRLPDHPALLRQPGLLRLRRGRRGRAGSRCRSSPG